MQHRQKLHRQPGTKFGTHDFKLTANLGLNNKNLEILHTTLDNDRGLVLEIVKECIDGNFARFQTLSKGGGLDWVQTYANVSKITWERWKTKAIYFRQKQRKNLQT